MSAQQKAEAGMQLLREAVLDFIKNNGGSASAREIRIALPVFKRAKRSDPLWAIIQPMVDEEALRIDRDAKPHRIVLT